MPTFDKIGSIRSASQDRAGSLYFVARFVGFEKFTKVQLAAVRRQVRKEMELESIEQLVLKQTLQRFKRFGHRAKRSPDGRKWAPLSEARKQQRARAGKVVNDILVFSGKLRDSITTERRSFNVRSKVAQAFSVTATAPYANLHQSGGINSTGGFVPARPFMGVGGRDQDQIDKELQKSERRIISAYRRGRFG